MERYTQASQEHTTTSRLRDHAFDLLERNLSAFLRCDSHFGSCALFFACVCGVTAIVVLYVFLLPPYSRFNCDQLCKA
jgi:hypothetical protein